jgi:uncharacterized membrane protein
VNQPPPQPENQSRNYTPATIKSQVMGLDNNVAGMLCYMPILLIGLICSLIFWKTEPADNKFLRFHAMQSLILSVGALIFFVCGNVIFGIMGLIPIIGAITWVLWGGASCLISIGLLYICITQMISAYKGGMEKIYRIGDIAEQKLAGS